MKWIAWQKWENGGMTQFGQMPLKNVQGNLDNFRQRAVEVLEDTRADHVLYAVKHYDEAGELYHVNFYMEPMTDEEFERVVQDTVTSDMWVGAVHKRS